MNDWLLGSAGLLAIIFAAWLACRALDRRFGEDSDLFGDEKDDEP
jgi:hypothetical protein